jgi:hypothetical protein
LHEPPARELRFVFFQHHTVFGCIETREARHGMQCAERSSSGKNGSDAVLLPEARQVLKRFELMEDVMGDRVDAGCPGIFEGAGHVR